MKIFKIVLVIINKTVFITVIMCQIAVTASIIIIVIIVAPIKLIIIPQEHDEITKLKNEISYVRGMYERSESRIISLEEERSRLEAATKELERSIASANYSPNSAVHRQVGLSFTTYFCTAIFLHSDSFLLSSFVHFCFFSYSLSSYPCLFPFFLFRILSHFSSFFPLTALYCSGLIRTQTLKADP